MERREFLKVAVGFAAGAAALAASAQAAPLLPQHDASNAKGPHDNEAKPALADQHDLDEARVEQVRWGRRRGWGFRRRHWGWRRRRFWGYRRHWHRRRYWGFRRRHWRRRRYW